MKNHLLFFCLLACILSLTIFSCEKEYNGVVPYETNMSNLKDKEVVWDGTVLDLFSRYGVVPNHVFHPGSWTTDSYFLNILRQYKIYNHGAIDSISYNRVNVNSANAGFVISNYDITIYYKNGFIDLLEGYLCPTMYGDNFTQKICAYPINKDLITDLHFTVIERTGKSFKDKLTYRGFQTVALFEWQVTSYFDGVGTIQQVKTKEPESSKSLQYQPKHII